MSLYFALCFLSSLLKVPGQTCPSANQITEYRVVSAGSLRVAFDDSVPMEIRNAISQAVLTWSEHLQLSPEMSCRGNRPSDLRFTYVKGDHHDGFPFLSHGLKVSHVVSMVSDESTPEIHLNAETNWKTDGSDPDVYTVALHEVGHALKMPHSENLKSIMYPWYGRERRILDRELSWTPVNSCISLRAGS